MTKMLETAAANIAAELNVDETALKGLLLYIDNVLKTKKGAAEAFAENPDLFVEAATKAYDKHMRAYYAKLLDPDSKEYKKLASDVYDKLTKKK